MNRLVFDEILPPADAKPIFVNRMFARIAPTYDLMNRLMTMGQDRRWRRELLQYADLPPRGRLLDVGTGTGDIAYTAQVEFPGVHTVGVDFTYEMMAIGRAKRYGKILSFVQGDTYCLPFPDNTFDAVTSGFLVRNVVDRAAVFKEQARVIKPGGRVVCLETTPPANMVFEPLYAFYFFRLVPLIGGLVSGDRDAYTYLPHSTVQFPLPAELQQLMEHVGLRNVFYVERMFGAVAIHVGTK